MPSFSTTNIKTRTDKRSVMANLSKIEEKILKKVAESQLITKMELKTFLKSNGASEKEGKDLTQVVDSATKGLIEKQFLTAISPVGSTCYIITQKGTRILHDMEE